MNSEPVRGSQPAKLRLAPDNRKGLLRVIRSPAEGTIQLQWVNRTSGDVQLDLMVFPHDVTFKRVRTGNDKDRVYELKFVAGDRAFYFWMQVSCGI